MRCLPNIKPVLILRAEGFDALTYARFDDINNDIFKKTLGPVEKIMDDVDVGKSEVDEIVLVVEFTRIPKVHILISE